MDGRERRRKGGRDGKVIKGEKVVWIRGSEKIVDDGKEIKRKGEQDSREREEGREGEREERIEGREGEKINGR